MSLAVFQEKQRFLTDVLHEVMLLDGLASSHPVSQEVQQATDIDRVFDWIAYKKVGIEKNACVFLVFSHPVVLTAYQRCLITTWLPLLHSKKKALDDNICSSSSSEEGCPNPEQEKTRSTGMYLGCCEGGGIPGASCGGGAGESRSVFGSDVEQLLGAW